MISSFILLCMLSVMYFYDQKKNLINEVKDEMIAYVSLSRNGKNYTKNDYFHLNIKPSKDYNYPTFYEKNNTFTSVTCASKYLPNKVFIVTASKEIISNKLNAVILKISIIMFSTFFIFLGVGYYLALISIKPLKKSSQIINQIIEDLLHDLNAPMSAISINCESLNETISSQRDKKKVNRIFQSNKTIKFLYNNLSMLIDNQTPLKYENININNIIKDRVEFYSDLSPEVNFNLSLEESIVSTNYDSLQRILDNLISNAIKYSQPNPIIQLTTTKSSIIIEDNGIGIKNCANIFNRYFREKHILGSSCGLGLGLSIVQRLCNELNIKIEYEDLPDGGSKFILIF